MYNAVKKVLCFCLPLPTGDVDAVATDARGNFLSAQVCSGPNWAKKDLEDSGFHGWFFRQALGNNYQTEWCDRPPDGWDGQRQHTDESVRPWHEAGEIDGGLPGET